MKYFNLVWLFLSVLAGLAVLPRISNQRIELQSAEIVLPKIDEKCNDVKSCLLPENKPIKNPIIVSDKQLEGFDNFFPLSSITKLNIIAGSSLETNLFLEVTKPEYSARIRNVKIFCNLESDPRFNSENLQKEFKDVRPSNINTIISEYFSCNPSRVSLLGPSERVEVAPNEYVKFTTQGDSVIIAQSRYIIIDPDLLAKVFTFIIVFVISLVAGNIIQSYLSTIVASFRNRKAKQGLTERK